MMKNISVIIPVYNSQATLASVVNRLISVIREFSVEYELIFINDGSIDQSWDVICDLCSQYSWVRGINLMRNYGQHNALLCGIRAAQYDTIVTMDDDLQHPPEEIPKLTEQLDKGYDVVYGTPHKKKHGFWRGIASWTTRMVMKNSMGIQIAGNASAFRAFRSCIRNAFGGYEGPFVSIDVLLTWGTTRFAVVAVRHEHRQDGSSQYTFQKLIVHSLNMMTGYSTVPLRLASVLGFGFSLFGLFVLIYVVVRYLVEGGSVPGFPFLAAIIAIFSGVQLFTLGIIGEYLSRMHFRTMKQPAYAIRNRVNIDEEEAL